MKTLRKKIGVTTLRGSAPAQPGPTSPTSAEKAPPLETFRTPPPEPIPALATEVQDAAQCLKLIHAKSVKNSTFTATSMESEHALSEALGGYSSRLHLRDESDDVLGQCLGDLQQLIVYVQNLRGAMDGAVKGKVNIPMNEFIHDDLKRAKLTKKKFDKANQNLDNASYKLSQLQKGKINLVKIVEAEGERDAMKKVFDEEAVETTKVLKEVNDRNRFETLEQLCEYFEEYKKFFKAGHMRMTQLEPKLKEYRAAVEARKQAFRNEGKQVADRVRLSSTTLEFKDINVSLWEKETDKKKIAVMQLVEDERLYLALLNSLMVNYRDVLLFDEKFTQKIERGDITLMFSGLSDLYHLHTTIYRELKEQLAAYPSHDIGAVFLQNANALQTYTQFVINNSTKQDAVDRSERNSSNIKAFLKVSEEKDEANLRILLSVPCGRIKKYEKFIQLMLEQINAEEPAHHSLSEAMSSLQLLSSSVEQGLEISERLVKVLTVRNALLGYDQLDSLVDRHREYVAEGPLMIANTAMQKKAEEHYFFVFNNLIIYTKKESSLQSMIGISSTKYKYVGSIPIQDGCSLREVIDNDVMHIRHAFELAWSGNSLLLMAESHEAKQAWKNTLSGVLNSLATDRVFGVSLNDLMTGRENGKDIPYILEYTIQWLRDNNVKHVEGIFRVSGMMTEVQEFKARADQGLETIFTPTSDPHCVAGVLKLWIREMPQPLLTYELYDQFLQTKHIGEEKARIRETAALVKALPQFNRFTLQYLMQYLHEVSLNCEENKMNSHNLSIVFGPNLLYRDTADPFDCSQFQEVYDVVRFLIVHYESLFAPLEPERLEFRASHKPNPIGSSGGAKPKPPPKQSVPTPTIPSSALSSGATSGGSRSIVRGRPPVPAGPVPSRPPAGGLPSRPTPSLPPTPSPPQPAPSMQTPSPSSGGSEILPPMPGGTPVPAPPGNGGGGGPALPGGAMLRPDLMKQLQQAQAKRLPTSPSGQPPSTPPPGVPSPSSGGRTAPAPSSQGLDSPVTGLRKLSPRPPNRASPRTPGSSEQPEEPPSGELVLPACACCSLPISGKGINALEQKWHVECFVCTKCHQPFTGSYVPHEGKPYCAPHFAELFGKRCGGCGELITGAFLQAIGRDWHPEHFVCCNCKGSLTDGFFEHGEGQPVCSACSPLFFAEEEGGEGQ